MAVSSKKSSRVLTIGIFDGVHKGHTKVIKLAVREAKSKKKRSAILTFYPHPSKALNKERQKPLLMSLEHRLRLLEELKADDIFLVKFDANFASLSPGEFIERIVLSEIHADEVFVGENFFFGKGRHGDTGTLKKEAGKYGIKVNIVPTLVYHGMPVSSTVIRHLVMTGKLDQASKLLGRRFSLLGTVVHGDKRGRELGFPTANLDLHHEVTPPSGVYAVKVNVDGKTHNGIVNIGFRPTFKGPDAEKSVEVYIFDFKKDIYGKDVEAVFVKKLRNEIRFKNASHLLLQIQKDIKTAKKILS